MSDDIQSCVPCDGNGIPVSTPLPFDDTLQNLNDVDVDWILKISTGQIPAGATPSLIVGRDSRRVKLTICLYVFSGSGTTLTVGQDATTLASGNGIPLHQQTAANGPTQLIERNIEDDKAECTHAWFGFNPGAGATVLLYVSETVFAGNPNRCSYTRGKVWPQANQ